MGAEQDAVVQTIGDHPGCQSIANLEAELPPDIVSSAALL